jgi:hypothetical protein
MKLLLAIVLLFSIFLSGCFEQQRNQNPELPPGPISICKQDNFQEFFEYFSTSIDAQKQYTRFPLEKLEVDAMADPEPLPQEFRLEKSQIVFPIFPGPDEIKSELLSIDISISGNEAKVRLFKPDTDYSIEYIFQHEECWNLIRVEDWSL